MPIDRDVLEAIREMDEPELRRLFMLTRARLEQRGHEFPDLGPDVKIRKQMVKCGKESCTTCPHGPYVYAYWHEDGKRPPTRYGKRELQYCTWSLGSDPDRRNSEEGIDRWACLRIVWTEFRNRNRDDAS